MVRQINVLTYPSPSPSPPFRGRGDLFRASSMRGLTDSASSILLLAQNPFHFPFHLPGRGRRPEPDGRLGGLVLPLRTRHKGLAAFATVPGDSQACLHLSKRRKNARSRFRSVSPRAGDP